MRLPQKPFLLVAMVSILFPRVASAMQWSIPQPRHPEAIGSRAGVRLECTSFTCKAGNALRNSFVLFSSESAKRFFGAGTDGAFTNSVFIARDSSAGAFVEYYSKVKGILRLGLGLTAAGSTKSPSDTLPPDKALFDRFQTGGGTFAVTLAAPVFLLPNEDAPAAQLRVVALWKGAADFKNFAVGTIVPNPRAVQEFGANGSFVLDFDDAALSVEAHYGWANSSRPFMRALGIDTTGSWFANGYWSIAVNVWAFRIGYYRPFSDDLPSELRRPYVAVQASRIRPKRS